MRTLVYLASEKRLRAHIEMTSRAGGAIVVTQPYTPTDADQYTAELGDLA